MKSDYASVGEFHKKFGLPTEADGPPRPLTTEELMFRFRFMLEELAEFAEAMGLDFQHQVGPLPAEGAVAQDLPKAADALIDLSYVTLGTGQMMRLPWAALFADVQRANMTKERCGIDHRYAVNGLSVETADGHVLCGHFEPSTGRACGKLKIAHSVRGSALDVIKPGGWLGPSTHEILLRAGWNGPALPLEGE